ncbi:O-methyltransferase [Halopelagius longus]|uniref:O-methyltransferase n=1 Tax=Halopelagius longus TaxID=1236180 RepID=A0A1H1B0A3_9EURY|nr:O-methyltransferase [Halopelagius longus]RDI70589.1 O-methyltransferase [Halopelagius longus]SDQ45347.1 Predicted O-methyltransferase YrrM [Halopelagius longus]
MSDDAETIRRLVRGLAPEHDEIHAEMAAYADEHGFPIVGREAGGVLRLLARLTDAAHVFEFGSGFGYSAYWFSKGAASDAQFVLTEHDTDELDMARDFFERAGLSDRTEFREGDALSAIEEYDGPFDAVLVDHQKSRYAEAFRAVRSKVSRGGVVVADNVTHGPADAAALARYLEGESLDAPDEQTKGIASYLDAVRADPEYETVLLPVGSGLAVSVRAGRTAADA